MKTLKPVNILNTLKELFIQIQIHENRLSEKENGVLNANLLKDKVFAAACRKAGVMATMRQARKFRRGVGEAKANFHLTIEGRPIYNQNIINKTEV